MQSIDDAVNSEAERSQRPPMIDLPDLEIWTRLKELGVSDQLRSDYLASPSDPSMKIFRELISLIDSHRDSPRTLPTEHALVSQVASLSQRNRVLSAKVREQHNLIGELNRQMLARAEDYARDLAGFQDENAIMQNELRKAQISSAEACRKLKVMEHRQSEPARKIIHNSSRSGCPVISFNSVPLAEGRMAMTSEILLPLSLNVNLDPAVAHHPGTTV